MEKQDLIIFRERGHLFRVTLQCTGVFLYCWFPKIIILIMIIWSTSGARLHSGQCNHVTLQLGDIKTKFCLRQPFSFNCLSASMVTTVVRPAAATTQAEHLCPLTHTVHFWRWGAEVRGTPLHAEKCFSISTQCNLGGRKKVKLHYRLFLVCFQAYFGGIGQNVHQSL